MKKIKTILVPGILFLSVLFLGLEIAGYHQSAFAKSAHGGQAAHGESHGAKKDHGAGHGATHHGPPTIYYIYWLLLFACSFRAVKFLRAHQEEQKQQRARELAEIAGHAVEDLHVAHEAQDEHEDHGGHGHHPEASSLDKFLVLTVVAMFIFEQFPSLAHYHEPNSLGFIKFLIKAALGVSLMTYGILGMGEH